MKTKITGKRSLMKTVIYLSFALVITLVSCKDKPIPDCGCDSEPRTSIPENSMLVGQISFKEQIDINDTYYSKRI